ncbi:Ank2 [Symbiodinium sp. CCMP2592]|nr:Ank2 [Symbiodinium sp. CCMP2592]
MKRKFDPSVQLIRVWQLSGEELAAIPVEELRDVESLKLHLQRTCELPPRFRQKLLHDGVALEDDMVLDSPKDVSLVVLPLLRPTAEQADELLEAVRMEEVSGIEEILNRAQDPNAAGTQGETPLCVAAKLGYAEIAELLLEAGADKDKPSLVLRHYSYDATTPLGVACQNGHTDMVRLMLEFSASVQKKSAGILPLSWASAKGKPEIVRLLLDARADAGKTSAGGMPPIHVAILVDDVETTRMLLESRADVEEHGEHGLTALGLAAWCRHRDVMRLLLEQRADVEKRCRGNPVIDLAPWSDDLLSPGGPPPREISNWDSVQMCREMMLESQDYARRLRESYRR